MVCTRKKASEKNLLSQSNESLNDFVSANTTSARVAEDEVVEPQNLAIAGEKHLAKLVQVSHNQVFERDCFDKLRREVDNVVAAFKNWVQDAILKAMYSMVTPRVEMAVDQSVGHQDRDPPVYSKILARDFSVENWKLLRS